MRRRAPSGCGRRARRRSRARRGPTGGRTGGRKIPNTVFDVLAYRLGEGKSLAEAVKAPRVHTEGDLNLQLESTWPAEVKDRFKEAGYAVKAGTGAFASAIERDDRGGLTA